jgi:hypothetical protein
MPLDDTTVSASAGWTVANVAARYRISPDKVRAWTNRGELVAINTATALCGKPRWVVPPEALAAFEQRRAAQPRRRRRGGSGWHQSITTPTSGARAVLGGDYSPGTADSDSDKGDKVL